MFNYSMPRCVAVIVMALVLVACSGSDGAKKDAALSTATQKIDANTFKNDYFGVFVTKPESWHDVSLEQQEKLMGFGEDIFTHDNDDLKKTLASSIDRSFPIFMFTMHENGAPVAINPSVIGVAEYVGILPGVKTGADYFFHAQNLMRQSGLQYNFEEPYTQRVIDGVTFDTMHLTLTFNGTSVKQTYNAARHGDHVVSFIESYGSDEFKDNTSEIIDSIELDWD